MNVEELLDMLEETLEEGTAVPFAAAKRVVDLAAHAHGLRKRFCAHGHNHELLNIHVIRRVRAAVQNVHHRHAKLLCVRPAELAEKA